MLFLVRDTKTQSILGESESRDMADYLAWRLRHKGRSVYIDWRKVA